MHTVIIVVHVLAAMGLIGLVLLQHGKGADAGAAFGSGASATVFGARGSASFLTRATAILATVFFVTSLSLAYFSSQGGSVHKSVTEIVAPAAEKEMPAAPAKEEGKGAPADLPTPKQ